MVIEPGCASLSRLARENLEEVAAIQKERVSLVLANFCCDLLAFIIVLSMLKASERVVFGFTSADKSSIISFFSRMFKCFVFTERVTRATR